MNLLTGLSPQQLRKAADLRERIDALQNELEAILSGADTAATPAAVGPTGRRKRNMSAAGRARIAAAAKARWAKLRAERGETAPAKKAKRKFSPESRARLAALARERWAKAKRAGQGRL